MKIKDTGLLSIHIKNKNIFFMGVLNDFNTKY